MNKKILVIPIAGYSVYYYNYIQYMKNNDNYDYYYY